MQQLRYFEFQVVLRAERESETGLPSHRFHHVRMAMAENQRPPGKPIIQIRVPVHIEDARSLATVEKQRIRFRRAAQTARYAARQREAGPLIALPGTGSLPADAFLVKFCLEQSRILRHFALQSQP